LLNKLNNLHTIGRVLILLGLIIAVSACGFRLRGSVEVPDVLQQTHITGIAEFSVLNQELKRVLQRAGSEVMSQPGNAKSIISISGEKFRRRVLSVDATGRASEFELYYQYNFKITNTDGEVIVKNQKISLTRDYKFDPDNVLAKDAEESLIRTDMIKFSVRQMMRRIDSQLKSAQTK